VAVFLDLSTGRNVMAEGESLVLPMYRALLDRLGYSRNVLLAELEIALEGDGELERFQQAFQEASGGKPWTTRRDVQFAKGEASKALHLLRPDVYPAADSWAKTVETPEVTHNWFATRAIELLSRRGGAAKRLVFVVDEAGQYVARSIDRMLDLQGVAEAFQKKQGPLWLIVTSQEKLEDVIDSLESKKIELARAKDRFPNRVDLLPSDIYEVASRRVLDKTDEGRRAVRTLFAANRNKLTANVRLESAGRVSELAEDEFIRLYPIVPYQVDVLIDAVSARRAHGAGSLILGGSNRTIIKLAQQLVVDPHVGLATSEIGVLATIDRAARLLESILPTAWQGEIDQVADRHGQDGPHVQVMRTVALTSDVKALPLTAGNLAAMLHPTIDAESRRAEIQDALDALVTEDRLRKADEGYQIQSPEQKDWEKSRRGKEPTPAEAIRIRKQLLRQALAGLSVGRLRVFKVELTVEGEKLADGDVALHIEEASPERREELRAVSREQVALDRTTWAYTLGEDTYDAIVELHRSDGMIDLKDVPSKTQTDIELLAEERRRRGDAEKRLLQRLTRDLAAGQVIFRGQISDVPNATGLAALAKKIVEERLDTIYPRLREFATTGLESKLAVTILRADDLAGLPDALGDDGIGLIQLTPDGYRLNVADGPLADLLAEIDKRASIGQIVSGSVIEKEFAKPPRGASLEVVEVLAAAGVRAGRLEVTHQGARIVSATDARLEKVFGTVPAFRAASFAPAKEASEVPLETRVELAQQLQALTGARPPHDVAGLARELRDFFAPDGESAATVASALRGAGLPVPDSVTNTHNVVSSLKTVTDSEAIRTLKEAWTDLLAGRETVHRLAGTLDEDLALYRQARDQLAAGSAGLPPDAANALEQLGDLVAAGDLATHRADIAARTSRVAEARKTAQQAAASALTEKLSELRQHIHDRFSSLDADTIEEALRPVNDLEPPEDPSDLPVEVLTARGPLAEAAAADAERRLEELRAAGRLAWVDVKSVVPSPIETEDQLEAALDAVRDAVAKHLADEKQVRLL
jgi:hypothetical protein